mmetsp:Transcript_71186/g.231261  ORF Transcript_71186/g.231261 Transcript_71186/m.231261 type:complete len:266 (-) Transcript_71186:44-841(-)
MHQGRGGHRTRAFCIQEHHRNGCRDCTRAGTGRRCRPSRSSGSRGTDSTCCPGSHGNPLHDHGTHRLLALVQRQEQGQEQGQERVPKSKVPRSHHSCQNYKIARESLCPDTSCRSTCTNFRRPGTGSRWARSRASRSTDSSTFPPQWRRCPEATAHPAARCCWRQRCPSPNPRPSQRRRRPQRRSLGGPRLRRRCRRGAGGARGGTPMAKPCRPPGAPPLKPAAPHPLPQPAPEPRLPPLAWLGNGGGGSSGRPYPREEPAEASW